MLGEMMEEDIGHDQEQGGKDDREQGIALEREGEQHPDQSDLGGPKDGPIPLTGSVLFHKRTVDQGSQCHIHPTQ